MKECFFKKHKRIFALFSIFSLASMMLLPFGSAFAYNGGLLNGKTMFLGSSVGTGGSTSNVTDNNESTSISLSGTGSTTDTLWYTFSEPVDLTDYQLKASTLGTPIIAVVFADGITQNMVNPPNKSGVKTGLTAQNVKSIYVYNASTTASTIYEFDVFGSVSASGDTMPPANVTDLTSSSITQTGFNVGFTAPSDSDLDSFKVYLDGVLKTTLPKTMTSYSFSGLTASTSYNVKVTSLDATGNESNGSTITVTTSDAVDTVAPNPVTGLTETHTDTTAHLQWTNPTDLDLAKIKILQNGSVIYNDVVISSYDVSNLVPSTSYGYTIYTIDSAGNESTPVNITLVTDSSSDTTAPVAPTGLVVQEGSSALYATWNSNSESDIQGYNIYVNGVKYNTALLSNNNANIANLTNGESYSITVTAVDTSGNESVQSSAVLASPSSSGMPLVAMGYDLSDVAKGIEEWFASSWGILAFAIGIPLSFYVASRVKLLFIS